MLAYAFAMLTDKIDAMSSDGKTNMDDMSREDYELFNTLLDQREQLRFGGHVGKSVRYE